MSKLKRQIVWVGRTQFWLAALTACVTGGFVFAGYRPQAVQLQTLRSQSLQTQQQLLAGQSRTSILPAVAADVTKLKAELERNKTLPRQQELPQFIRDIAQLANQCNLSKFDLKPGTPARDERFNQLPIQLSFDGDFLGVFNFLRHTEQLHQLTRVKTIDVKSKDKTGQVHAQLTLIIYFAAE